MQATRAGAIGAEAIGMMTGRTLLWQIARELDVLRR